MISVEFIKVAGAFKKMYPDDFHMLPYLNATMIFYVIQNLFTMKMPTHKSAEYPCTMMN